MKPGVIFLNTARAGLVDYEALYKALEEGKVAAAGLDVDELGLYPGLLSCGSVLLTPHNAYNTVEAVERINQTTKQNIISFVHGGGAVLNSTSSNT